MTAAERIALIRELCGHAGRRTGTDAERRAANAVIGQLTVGGRRATVEPIRAHPQVGLIYGLHCLAAIAGSLLAVCAPHRTGNALVLGQYCLERGMNTYNPNVIQSIADRIWKDR